MAVTVPLTSQSDKPLAYSRAGHATFGAPSIDFLSAQAVMAFGARAKPSSQIDHDPFLLAL